MKNQGEVAICSPPYEVREDCESPSRIRSRCKYAIPPGTVASRVRQLLTNPILVPPIVQASTSTGRRREHSRTGFGRRISPRFGHPAYRSDNPGEHHKVEWHHSYLGLNTARNDHNQEHAITKQRDTFVRTPGLHGLLEPTGRVKRLQYDAVSPWITVQSTKPAVNPKHSFRGEGVNETGTSRMQSRAYRDASFFPTLANEDGNRSGRYSREDVSRRQHHEHIKDSETSFRSTSSVRRKSVRVLFSGHGIERPAGLGSREPSRRQDGVSGESLTKVCHICSCYNTESNTRCYRCDHALCLECVIRTSQAIRHDRKSSDRPATKEERLPMPLTPTKDACSKEAKTKRRKSLHPDRSPEKVRHSSLEPKATSPVQKFPSIHSGEFACTGCESLSRDFSQQSTNTDHLKVTPPRSQVTTKANNSSSEAGSSSPRGNHSRPPFIKQKTEYTHDHREDSQVHCHGTQPRLETRCGTTTCRTTHGRPGFCRPGSYHKIPRLHSIYDTDEGYAAETSYAGDESHFQPRQPSCTYSSSLKSRSSRAGDTSPKSAYRKRSRRQSETIPCEYVECHGYPRTGHARHGSARSGDIGGCQHCQDDCQCKACQRTHHSVRCCSHGVHRSVVHHHHTHRLTDCDPQPIECSSGPTPLPTHASPPRSHTTSPITSRPAPRLSNAQILRQDKASSSEPRHDLLRNDFPNLPSSRRSVMSDRASKSETSPGIIPTIESTPAPLRPKTDNRIPVEVRLSSLQSRSSLSHSSDMPNPTPVKPFIPTSPSYGTSSTSRVAERVFHYETRANRRRANPPRQAPHISRKYKLSRSVGVPSRMDFQLPPTSYSASRHVTSDSRVKEKRNNSSLKQDLHRQEMKLATQECEDKLEAILRRREKASQQNGILTNDTKISGKISPALSKTVTLENNGNDPCAICVVNELNNLDHTLSEDESVSDEVMDDSPYHCEISEGLMMSDTDTQSHAKEDSSSGDGNATDQSNAERVEERQTSRRQKGVEGDTASRLSAGSSVSMASRQTGDLREPKHECVWKHRFLDESNGQDGEGSGIAKATLLCVVTVIIQREGREDLVMRNNLREGEHITTTTQITSD